MVASNRSGPELLIIDDGNDSIQSQDAANLGGREIRVKRYPADNRSAERGGETYEHAWGETERQARENARRR